MSDKHGKHSKPITGPSFVIAAYRPKTGKLHDLRELVRSHVPRLRELGLATDSVSHLLEAADGTLLEVFEWVSAEAVSTAHEHPEVLVLWEQFASLCDHVSPASVPECAELFPHFKPLASV